MLELTFGIRPQWGDYYIAREGKPTVAVGLGKYDLALMSDWFGGAHKMRQQNIFLPNPGSHCFSCGVKNACRVEGNSITIAKCASSFPAY